MTRSDGGQIRTIGIVTGLLEEALSFRPGSGDVQNQFPFYCRKGTRFFVACAGIGKVNAAMATMCLIHDGCDLIVSMGAAGRLRPGTQGAHWVKDAIQHDYGAMRPDEFQQYRAGSLPFGDVELEAYRPIGNPGIELPVARMLTGDCFVEDDNHASSLAKKLEGDLVDMETGAIAQVASSFGIPWAGIRAVSDDAAVGSVDTFQANLRRAAKEASRAVDQLVRMF